MWYDRPIPRTRPGAVPTTWRESTAGRVVLGAGALVGGITLAGLTGAAAVRLVTPGDSPTADPTDRPSATVPVPAGDDSAAPGGTSEGAAGGPGGGPLAATRLPAGLLAALGVGVVALAGAGTVLLRRRR